MQRAIAAYQEGFTAWAECPAVVIAQVHGYAIGAGFQLALAADLRVASLDAWFAMRETSLGLVPDLGGTGPLVHLVGYARALEICATGRPVSAPEAHAHRAWSTPSCRPPTSTRRPSRSSQHVLSAPDAAVRALKPLLRSAVTADRDGQPAPSERRSPACSGGCSAARHRLSGVPRAAASGHAGNRCQHPGVGWGEDRRSVSGHAAMDGDAVDVARLVGRRAQARHRAPVGGS